MDAETLCRMIEENTYAKTIGLEMLELREGYAEGRIPVKEESKNPLGTMHGGCLYSLADIVSGTAATLRGNYVTTVSGELSYLRPAVDTEYVTAKAREIRFGKNLAVYRVDLVDDAGTVLDIATFTFFDLGKPVEE